MKKMVILMLIVILSARASGQCLERKGYIGMMIGPSFPYDSFARKGQFFNGYAETGLNINLLNFGYHLWGNLGVTGSWFGIANPIDYFGSNGMWAVGAIMAGPLYSISLSDKFELDLKGMFGYVLLTKKYDYSSETAAAYGPGFEAGTMLHYNFSKKWCALLNFDTFNTQLDIQPDKDPKVSIINLAFGIAYRLK